MKNPSMVPAFGFCIVLFLIAAAMPALSAEGVFPEKPITWVVSVGPGGGFDVYSRAIARVMPKYLPRQANIIIRNMPGAGHRLATNFLYRSKPDGYTIGLLNFTGLVIAEVVMKTKFDMDKFVYLGEITTDSYGLWVPADSPFRTLADLQHAKKPVRFTCIGKGSTGTYNTRLQTEALKIPAQIITGYKSVPAMIPVLMRGDADAIMEGGMSTLWPFVRAGQLRPILLLTSERIKALPDTPTVTELGYGAELTRIALHRVVAAPPGTPKEVGDILTEALRRSLEDEEIKKFSEKRPIAWASPEEVKEILTDLSKLCQKYKKTFTE